MKLQRLSITPKNPKHFIRLLWQEARQDPRIKEANDYIKLVEEINGNKALFKSAYGYFWINKQREVLSENFLKNKPIF